MKLLVKRFGKDVVRELIRLIVLVNSKTAGQSINKEEIIGEIISNLENGEFDLQEVSDEQIDDLFNS